MATELEAFAFFILSDFEIVPSNKKDADVFRLLGTRQLYDEKGIVEFYNKSIARR